MTKSGIAQRFGDRWVPFDIPGFPPGGTPFDLSEAPNGELLASIRISPGNMSVFMTNEGRWQDLGNSAVRSLVTRSGRILSTEIDLERLRMRVRCFKDSHWTAVSAWTKINYAFVSNLVEAPDGAIWGVGNGIFSGGKPMITNGPNLPTCHR